jgi:mRNA-degrading endonuclease RelE of RelBE toxin-antitoxin system
MASFEIEWKRSAVRELRKLPKEIVVRIVTAVEALAQDPHQ